MWTKKIYSKKFCNIRKNMQFHIWLIYLYKKKQTLLPTGKPEDGKFKVCYNAQWTAPAHSTPEKFYWIIKLCVEIKVKVGRQKFASHKKIDVRSDMQNVCYGTLKNIFLQDNIRLCNMLAVIVRLLPRLALINCFVIIFGEISWGTGFCMIYNLL